MHKTLSNSYKNKTDEELVDLVRNESDSKAFEEICLKYENIFYKICQKYSVPLTISGVNPQEIFDEKNTIILHCVNTYHKDKKAKLSTWIGNNARYLCLNTINERKFTLAMDSDDINKYIEGQQQVNNFVHKGSSKDDFQYVSNLLDQIKDKRIKNIIYLRYFSGQKKMIWTKIAKKMNISTQTAINLHNKGIDLLRSKLKSKSISDVI